MRMIIKHTAFTAAYIVIVINPSLNSFYIYMIKQINTFKSAVSDYFLCSNKQNRGKKKQKNINLKHRLTLSYTLILDEKAKL